jgi:hypothetical protein
MEDLGFADRGTDWKEELAGMFDLAGEPPLNPDGVVEATNADSQQRRDVAHRCFFQANLQYRVLDGGRVDTWRSADAPLRVVDVSRSPGMATP